ncbi:hypothetical protein HZC53_00945 [Candidatus Uhrbacteria bacterium]|nr:hypothetical protein [Candidatus Uhrbacteria bacterium]
MSDEAKQPTKTDSRTQAIKQAWTEFSRNLGQIKGRISNLKETKEENERTKKLKSIQQAIKSHK